MRTCPGDRYGNLLTTSRDDSDWPHLGSLVHETLARLEHDKQRTLSEMRQRGPATDQN